MDSRNNLGVPKNYKPYCNLNTPNGSGSTGTCVKLYTVIDNPGGFTAVNDAVYGSYIQIPESGVYSVFRQANSSASGNFIAISVNSNQLSTAIESINVANILVKIIAPNSNGVSISYTGYFNAGDIIRAHDEAAGEDNGTTVLERLVVTRLV